MNKTKKELMDEIEDLKKALRFIEENDEIKKAMRAEFKTKTKAQLLEEIEELRKEIRSLEKYKEYEEYANDLASMTAAYEQAGFTREEVMRIIVAAASAKR